MQSTKQPPLTVYFESPPKAESVTAVTTINFFFGSTTSNFNKFSFISSGQTDSLLVGYYGGTGSVFPGTDKYPGFAGCDTRSMNQVSMPDGRPIIALGDRQLNNLAHLR